MIKDNSKSKFNKRTISIIAIVLAVALVAVVLLIVKPFSDDKAGEARNSGQPETGRTADNVIGDVGMSADDGTDIEDVDLYKVGEYMEFATQKMRVNSAELTDTISDGSGYSSPAVAGDGTKFLVVNITVENTSVAPFNYRDFMAYTSKDSKLEKQYSAYDSYGEINDSMQHRDLQPNIPETGNVVYRVPSGYSEFQIGGAVSGASKALHTLISL